MIHQATGSVYLLVRFGEEYLQQVRNAMIEYLSITSNYKGRVVGFGECVSVKVTEYISNYISNYSMIFYHVTIQNNVYI